MKEEYLKLKIALCDDQPSILAIQYNLIKQILNEMALSNYQMMTFSSAEDYLNTEETFDLLFLDIEMPAVDGFNLAGELKRRQTETKIIKGF